MSFVSTHNLAYTLHAHLNVPPTARQAQIGEEAKLVCAAVVSTELVFWALGIFYRILSSSFLGIQKWTHVGEGPIKVETFISVSFGVVVSDGHGTYIISKL
jgi:hypothetical protein